MNRIFSFLKGAQLNRLLAVAAVSLLMFFGTACSRADATDTATLKELNSPNTPGQSQPYKGGMNNFDDVDATRFDKADVDAKAKALKDRVERNINQKGIDSPEQYVKNFRSGTPLQERIENIGDDIGRTANEAKESLGQFGERGSKNIERNVRNASGQTSRTFDQTKRNTKAAAEDLSRGVKEPIDNATNAAKRAMD
ncbi:MAG: hypothetical protein KME42_21390 [Tildeniella nuda ZEHNDER 1965/U140]|jgi:gas vesicle protein|nr:hypothetical protein [Tildeniella nuda ZEHNDER 1965/U140]